MTERARFMFDECIPKPSMIELGKLLPSTLECAHICDRLASGALDKDWVPQIASEGRWIVITADAGKKSNLGGKLPELCKENKITHVVLSPALHKLKIQEKAGALLLVWDQIESLEKEPAGSRFKLMYRQGKKNVLRVVLKKVEED